MTRYIAVKTQDSKLIANLCQSCSRACPLATLQGPTSCSPDAKCSPYASQPAAQQLRLQRLRASDNQICATFTGRRPKASIQRLLRAVRAAVAGARLQHFCALPRLSPRRRRPASVSNCCGRPQMPTADWALRSSVLNKVVARNVCYITEESRPAKMSGHKLVSHVWLSMSLLVSE